MDPQTAQSGMSMPQVAGAGQQLIASPAGGLPSQPVNVPPHQAPPSVPPQHLIGASASPANPTQQQSSVNPSAVQPGAPVLSFFGGYPTQQNPPPATVGQSTPIGSKASFCSLQPKSEKGM